jgi:hypothetical protein
LWASAAEAKPSTATVVKTKARERIVEETFIVKSPKREGVFLRERMALFTLSYGRLPGCYSRGQEFQKTSENAGKLAKNTGEDHPARWAEESSGRPATVPATGPGIGDPDWPVARPEATRATQEVTNALKYSGKSHLGVIDQTGRPKRVNAGPPYGRCPASKRHVAEADPAEFRGS